MTEIEEKANHCLQLLAELVAKYGGYPTREQIEEYADDPNDKLDLRAVQEMLEDANEVLLMKLLGKQSFRTYIGGIKVDPRTPDGFDIHELRRTVEKFNKIPSEQEVNKFGDEHFRKVGFHDKQGTLYPHVSRGINALAKLIRHNPDGFIEAVKDADIEIDLSPAQQQQKKT